MMRRWEQWHKSVFHRDVVAPLLVKPIPIRFPPMHAVTDHGEFVLHSLRCTNCGHFVQVTIDKHVS